MDFTDEYNDDCLAERTAADCHHSPDREGVDLVPKKSPWSNNGGARKGAGRKPKPNAKEPVNLRMSPDIVAWVKSLDNQSVEVEAVLRRCKAFREFAK